MELKIVYEDQYFLVYNKPAGLLVYLPQGAKPETVLVDIVRPKIDFKDYDERSGIVHRLDRETSGLILVAKNEDSQNRLKELFKERQIEKKYKALVWGKVEPERGEIRIPLGRGAKDRLRIVPDQVGREALTVYRVIKYFPESDITLVDVDLKTGRTHQIRVHFNAIGHPLVGDEKYSRRKSPLGRQFLHAYSLSFKHPFTGENLNLTSELPEDLDNYLLSLS